MVLRSRKTSLCCCPCHQDGHSAPPSNCLLHQLSWFMCCRQLQATMLPNFLKMACFMADQGGLRLCLSRLYFHNHILILSAMPVKMYPLIRTLHFLKPAPHHPMHSCHLEPNLTPTWWELQSGASPSCCSMSFNNPPICLEPTHYMPSPGPPTALLRLTKQP